MTGPTPPIRDVVWTPETNRRFWDLHSVNTGYWSEKSGGRLIAFVSSHAPLSGRVLDFGCGPGFLLEKLVAAGITTEGVDFSQRSIELASSRCARYPAFAGVKLATSIPIDAASATYDCIFLVETLEHLMDDERTSTLAELHRLLKPDGRLVITVPNREDLDKQKLVCPKCGCRFHRYQHQTSWTPSSLSTLLATSRFQEQVIAERNLYPLPVQLKDRVLARVSGTAAPERSFCPECTEEVRPASPDQAASGLVPQTRRVAAKALKLLAAPPANLIYIGRKVD